MRINSLFAEMPVFANAHDRDDLKLQLEHTQNYDTISLISHQGRTVFGNFNIILLFVHRSKQLFE